MIAERRRTRRDPILMTWLGLSIALNVAGMASLVDGFVVWIDFIRQVINLYHTLVRDPILWVFHAIWPSTWPRVPAAIVDVMLMWSWLFLAINLATYRVAGLTLLSNALARIKDFWSILGFMLVFLITYITEPFRAVRLLMSPSSYKYNVLFPHRQDATFSILYALLFIFGLFVLLLFMNYQIKRLAPA